MNLSRWLVLFLGCFWLQESGASQLEEFKAQTKLLYHHLEQSDIQNFSCLFTSGGYMDFVQQYQPDSTELYPLKLLWTRAGRIYYILLPYPRMNDPANRQKVLEKIQLTKNQFHGFYLDWLNYLILSPVDDIPAVADLQVRGDSIVISYTSEDEGASATVQKIFLRSGRLLQVVVETAENRVTNSPFYQEVEGKWLCYGWDTRIYQGNEVSSGLAARLELRKQGDYWFPARVVFQVQTMEQPDQKFQTVLFIKDYQFDLPIQELPMPESEADSLPH